MTDSHEIVPAADVVTPGFKMHPLVERVLQHNPTAETLREVITLQRESEAAAARRAYESAFVELKRDLPLILNRDQTVDYTNKEGRRTYYKHTSLAHALEEITPHLINYGFAMTWQTENLADGRVKVIAKLKHRGGHEEPSSLTAPPDSSGNKSVPQAIASTVTLLERYTGLALLGIATADMKEPTGEDAKPDAGAVDTKLNVRTMGELKKAGKTKEAAEAHVGKPLPSWTAEDVAKLVAWIESPKKVETEAVDLGEDGSGIIGTAYRENVTKWASEFKLAAQDMRKVVFNASGLTVRDSSQLTNRAYALLDRQFGRLRRGEIDFDRKALKFIEPPSEPGADLGEDPEDAKNGKLPF